MKCSCTTLMLCGRDSSWNADFPDSRSQRVMWPLWPGSLCDHFAMNVAIRPLRWARALVKHLNSMALSAIAKASSTASAASSTPGPVSVCSPSIGMSMVSVMSMRSR